MNYHFKCETKKACRNFTKVVHFSSKKVFETFFEKKKKKLCNGNFSHQQVIFKTGSLSEEIELDFLFSVQNGK